MHSSKKKNWIRAALFLAVFVAADVFLGFGLLPNTFARISIHSLNDSSVQDVFIGTSKGQCSIDPETVDQVTGRKSTNLCLGAEYPLDCLYLVKEAERTCRPERVIYELDPCYYTAADYSGIEDPFIFNSMPFSTVKLQYYLDKNLSEDFRIGMFPWLFHRNEIVNFSENLQMKNSEAYKEYSPDIVGDGTSVFHSNGFMYFKRIQMDKEVNYLTFDSSIVKQSRIDDLKRLISYCSQQGIELTVIVLPVPADSLSEKSADYAAADAYFRNIMDACGVEYLNFNYINTGFDNSLDGYRDYEGHMWGDTAENFSSILGTYLTK